MIPHYECLRNNIIALRRLPRNYSIRQMVCLFRTLFERIEFAKRIEHVIAIHPMERMLEDEDPEDVPERSAAVREALVSRQVPCAQMIWGVKGANAWAVDLDFSTEQAQTTILLALCSNLRHLTVGTYNGSLKHFLGLDLHAPENPDRYLGIGRQRFLQLKAIDVCTDAQLYPYNNFNSLEPSFLIWSFIRS